MIWGFPARHGGYPNSWMVYVMENPIYNCMRTGGTTIYGDTMYGIYMLVGGLKPSEKYDRQLG